MPNLWRAVLDSCERGLCVLDGEGRLLAMNRAAESLLGWREDELQGRKVVDQAANRPLAPCPASGDPAPGWLDGDKLSWRRRDGSTIELGCTRETFRESDTSLSLLQLRLEPARRVDGAVCHIEANFRAILDTITDGVIVIDELGIIQLFNPGAERVFGYRRDEAIGRNVKFLMPEPDRSRHDQYLANYRRTGIRKIIGIGREVVGQRKDGTLFPLYLSIGELRQGGQRLFVGITRDLTRRKQDEEKLLILSRALDQSPVAIVIIDLDGRIEQVNQGFSRLTGYAADEVIGQNLRLLQTSDSAAAIYRELWDALRTGKEWHGEIQDRKKNGELYWAMETVTPILDGAGRVTRYLALQQDITQWKRDREALQESEQRFRHVAQIVGEWLWEQDPDGRYTYSSAAVQEILGYAPEEIVGRSYLDLLTEQDRSMWREQLPPLNHLGEPFRKFVNHYRHRDGHEVFTESSGAPLFGPDGRVVKWRGVDMDITARKRFEDALRLRDRAIEAANVGIVIADALQPHYPNIYVNPALARITGYGREELIGRSLKILQGPETSEEAKNKIRKALREGTYCEVVLQNYRKDGTPFWNELLLSPVRDESGTVTHYIGIQTDVTARRRAEEERRDLEIAKHIQLSLLPKAPLRLRGIEIAGCCVPATHVGGDYFDFFRSGDNLDVVIADVSGHSVGAALIMAEMRSTLKAEIRRERDEQPHNAAELLNALNDVMFSDLSGADLFITMFYLRYELGTRRLRYANAGHNRALLLRRNAAECQQLDADGLILGVSRKVAFEEKGLLLERGDSLLLYTDGAVEAQDEHGNFFGLCRLARAFVAHRALPPEALLDRLMEELRQFRGAGTFDDDISMVALKVT
ncbi:PAS domain S-box protein [Candidatus Methylocalor cossyra]